MRINNSRSSEIFDIFSDTMQKFNHKRSKRIIKKADRITGAVEAGEIIGRWLDAAKASDIGGAMPRVLGASDSIKSFTMADDIGGAAIKGFPIENPVQGMDLLEAADGTVFLPRDSMEEFIRAGGKIDPSDLGKLMSPRDAVALFGKGKGKAKRDLFRLALTEAQMPVKNPDGSIKMVDGMPELKPALTPEQKSEIIQRISLRAIANNGVIDQRHVADALEGLEPDQIAAITKKLEGTDPTATLRPRNRPGDGPGTGGSRPGDGPGTGGNRPGDGPGDGPGTGGNRPGDGPGDGPGTGGSRPGDGPGTGGNRPGDGPGDGPGTGGNRPGDGPGDGPGTGGNRPGDGPGTGGNRPGDGPGDGPGTGGNRPGDGPGTGGNRPGDGPGTGGPTGQLPPEATRVTDDLAERLNEVSRAGLETSVAQQRQLDAMQDALKKLRDLPPNPQVMRQIDSLKEAIKGLEDAGRIADGTADVAKMSGMAKFLLWTTAAAGAAAAFYWWPSVKSFFNNSPAMRKHDPEKVKQLFSTAHSTMSSCASDTGTVLSSMNAVSFTDNQVQRAHKRMIRELSTYNATLSSIKKASLSPNLSQEEIQANISMLNRTMAAMAGLVSIYMEDTGEIKSFAKDKTKFDQMQKNIKKVLPCYQNSLDTVRDEIKRLKIDTSEGESTSSGSGAAASTAGALSRPGGIPSNAAEFMYDPTVVATNIVKLPLYESIRVGNKMIDFVNIPMPRGFASRGELAINGAPFLAAALNDSRGRTILREEWQDIKLDPKMSGLKPEDIFQFATNRAAFKMLNAGANEDALDDIEIDETFQDAVKPTSEDKDDSWLRTLYTLGFAESFKNRQQERAADAAERDRQALGFADDGVTANNRKDQLKKISELIMSNENHRSSINKEVSKDSIRKKSDDFAKSYYKDAKKGLSTEDSFMKSYYAGFSDMYDESQNDKPKLDYKDSYSLHDETGDDLIHEAHPEAIVVSDAIGNGGLVENGSEQKRQSHGVAQSTPTGNYRANYAWLQEGLLKK